MELERRTFLGLAVQLGGAAAVAVVGGPALLTTLTPVFASRHPLWAQVGPLQDLPSDAVHKAIVEVPGNDQFRPLRQIAVFVLRTPEGEIVVFSRTCTDLGCPVTWDPGSGWFFCPCHGGIFSRDGSPQAGPPKRPLFRYATKIEDEVLWIDLNSIPPAA